MIVSVCHADPSFLLLFSWLAGAGLVGFLTMGIDKARATHHERRIPETALFTISFVGGFWGVLLGGFVFHHKTSKPEFLFVVFGGFISWLLLLQRIGFIQCLTSTF